MAKLPSRLSLPEPETQQSVSRWRHDIATFLQNVALGFEINQFDGGQVATGDITILAVPHDGDTVQIIVDDEVVTYEFDSNASVTAGRVAVTIAGTMAGNATNLATAITSHSQGARVIATTHAADTNVVDVQGRLAGQPLSLTESSSGRIAVQDAGNERGQETLYQFAQRRIVTAHDVARGRLVVHTGMTALVFWSVTVQESQAVPMPMIFDGEVTVTGGVIEIHNNGGDDVIAGNVVIILATGQRS